MAITIFASTAADSALAISIFAADELFYNIQPNAGAGIFTLIGGISLNTVVKSSLKYYLGSQLMSYGLGGIIPCLSHLRRIS